jgi:hypothetical protein
MCLNTIPSRHRAPKVAKSGEEAASFRNSFQSSGRNDSNPEQDRTSFFEETASRRSSTTTAVEKDSWVCWTLKHLFALKHVPELRFKGGTSLSKVFRLIDRFSEDIDISMDRAALGFTGERDLAHRQLSTTKRKALDVELREAITKEVASDLLPKLRASFEPILKKQKWMLVPPEEANEEMTLVFYYPRAFDYKDYLRPQIKLEFGRGDQQPSEKAPIISFVAEEFPKEFAEPFAEVTVLDAQRTFWEKVTLLHACGLRNIEHGNLPISACRDVIHQSGLAAANVAGTTTLEFVIAGRCVAIGPGATAFVGRSWPCSGTNPAEMNTNNVAEIRVSIAQVDRPVLSWRLR